MNYVKNDRGESVPAVGAPGSKNRARCEYPELIERINRLYEASADCYGRAIDRAVEMIRQAGVTNAMETNSILLCTLYALEPPGSVTSIVLRIR